MHTFDPTEPSLMKGIKDITSRLFTSTACKPIFGGTRILDSRREPSSLLRLFQHSKFDESGSVSRIRGVSKCGIARCKVCDEIIEGDSVFFRNVGFSYVIKSRMDCTVRNIVYALFCNGCGQSYIGETVNLRQRMSGHRNKSKYYDDSLAYVSRHLYSCGQGFKVCPLLKVEEECKLLRLVKEDQLVKLLKPDLNTDIRNLLHLQLQT